MKIYSPYSEPDTFDRMRRTRWGHFHFLVRGEWSQTPWHQGDITFDFAVSKKRDRVALLHRGFPRRIVGIAIREPHEKLEEVIGNLLFHVYVHDGPYIDLVDYAEEQDLDFDEVWETYRGLMRMRRLAKK